MAQIPEWATTWVGRGTADVCLGPQPHKLVKDSKVKRDTKGTELLTSTRGSLVCNR